MVKVMFRAQGNTERQAGVAVARRGSKLLIQYRIQDGSERERFITADRYEVVEGDAATLPVDAAPKYARTFSVTLPDGTVTKLGGQRNQDRAPIMFGFAKRFAQTPAQAAEFPNDRHERGWHLAESHFETREAAEAYMAKYSDHFRNGYYERVIVEVVETTKAAK